MSGSRRPLVIVGTGGHARVVLDAANALAREVAGFVSAQHIPSGTIQGVPVLGSDYLLCDPKFLAGHSFIVAVGNQGVRHRLSEGITTTGGMLETLIHPVSVISPSARIGMGSVVLAGCVANAGASIGPSCILNTACSVDHDVELAEGTQICPGARLAGGVRCGAWSFIGTGATIVPNVGIGARAVVGAGAVVLRDVPDDITVVGNPARPRL